MANKDRPARMIKKPKKDTKLKAIIHEETPPTVVEVVKRKRKERDPDED